jgi:methylamine dehydrogenase accessory protein MauD
MAAALLIARLILFFVFAIAGLAKCFNRSGTQRMLVDFGAPKSLAVPLSFLLPLVEVAVAAALIPSQTAWWGGVAALILLLSFVGAMVANLARGRAPDCQCFGQLHAEPIGVSTISRNIVLAFVAGIVAWNPSNAGPSMLGWLNGFTVREEFAFFAGVLVLALLIVEGAILVELLRQNGRLVMRIELLEAKTPSANEPSVGLPIGAPAPTFALTTLDGEFVELEQTWGNGKPALLFFTAPHCAACVELLPAIAQWQKELATSLDIVVLTRGTTEENRAKLAEHGIERVLLQTDREVVQAYDVSHTPAAVLVQTNGLIGSAVAVGDEEIRKLIAQATAPEPAPQSDKLHAPAPTLTLLDLNGKVVKLTDFVGTRTLVLFWSPTCGFCRKILPDVKAWEQNRPRRAPDNLLIVSSGTIEANRAQGLSSPMVLDEDGMALRAFGAPGTPTAILIDADGKFASHVEVGTRGALALLGLPLESAEQPTDDAQHGDSANNGKAHAVEVA